MELSVDNQTTSSQLTVINQSFGWMFLGLIVTGLSAYFIASSSSLIKDINNNGIIYFGLIAAELILVAVLSAKVRSMSFEEAAGAFLVFSFLNGLTLSSIFLVYTSTSIVSAFMISALVFGIMAIYGYTTKRDLTSIRSLAFMILIGLVIGYVINAFLNNNAFSYALSGIGIIIFVGLTAYDAKKIKQMGNHSDNASLGILGALTLYLDFINIFLDIIRFLGQSSRD
jgi:FtsH-binding integral membrane protein